MCDYNFSLKTKNNAGASGAIGSARIQGHPRNARDADQQRQKQRRQQHIIPQTNGNVPGETEGKQNDNPKSYFDSKLYDSSDL